MAISSECAEHYIWGEMFDRWYLLNRDDVRVNQERVPPGGAEVMHSHKISHLFFCVFECEGLMVFEDREVILERGKTLEIQPGVKHQFKNQSDGDVHFPVMSVPATRGDPQQLD